MILITCFKSCSTVYVSSADKDACFLHAPSTFTDERELLSKMSHLEGMEVQVLDQQDQCQLQQMLSDR